MFKLLYLYFFKLFKSRSEHCKSTFALLRVPSVVQPKNQFFFFSEYDGFTLRYPRASSPSLFADALGAWTAELALASAEISALVVRVPPVLQTLKLLQEQCEPFPGNEPEGKKKCFVIKEILCSFN